MRVSLLPEHEERGGEVSTVSQLVGSSLADPFEAPRENHARHKDEQKYDIQGKQRGSCRELVCLLANSRNGRPIFCFLTRQLYPPKTIDTLQ